MAPITGFQSNTTIHAAFWIYKPDPVSDPTSKEEFIEVNSIQRVECNSQTVLSAVTNVQVASNLLTVTVAANSGLRISQQVIFYGLTNATFLNGQVVYINGISGNTFTANFTNANYGPTTEPAGAQLVDTTNRVAYLYYAESSVSTSQAPRKLDGAVAARFIYDMEALFS